MDSSTAGSTYPEGAKDKGIKLTSVMELSLQVEVL